MQQQGHHLGIKALLAARILGTRGGHQDGREAQLIGQIQQEMHLVVPESQSLGEGGNRLVCPGCQGRKVLSLFMSHFTVQIDCSHCDLRRLAGVCGVSECWIYAQQLPIGPCSGRTPFDHPEASGRR